MHLVGGYDETRDLYESEFRDSQGIKVTLFHSRVVDMSILLLLIVNASVGV